MFVILTREARTCEVKTMKICTLDLLLDLLCSDQLQHPVDPDLLNPPMGD